MYIHTDSWDPHEIADQAKVTLNRLRDRMPVCDALETGSSLDSLRRGYREKLARAGGRSEIEAERRFLLRKLRDEIEIAEGSIIPAFDRFVRLTDQLAARVEAFGRDEPAAEFTYSTEQGGERTYRLPAYTRGHQPTWGECLDRVRRDAKAERIDCGVAFESIGRLSLQLRALSRVESEPHSAFVLAATDSATSPASERKVQAPPEKNATPYERAMGIMATLLLEHDGEPGDPVEELKFEGVEDDEILENEDWTWRDFSESKEHESICAAIARLAGTRWNGANSVYAVFSRERKKQRENGKPSMEMTSDVSEWVEECRGFVENELEKRREAKNDR